MADMDTLYRALRNADAAGDVESARKISNYIKGLQPAAPPPRPPSKERTMGEAVSDIGAGLTSGFGSLVQLPGQLYGLATGDFSKTGFLGAGQEISELGQEMKSAGLKAREQARAQKVKEAEEKGQVEAFGAALGETVKDPGLLLNFLTEQAPQLIVPFGGAKIAKGLTMARAGAAGVPLAEAAQAAGTAGTRAAIGTGAVQQGADIGAQAYEDIYKKLKSDGLSDEDAAAGAINLARATGASGAVISLLAQRLPGARTLEEALAGVPGKAGRVVGAGKGALGESASEMAEEVGGKLAQNIAMRQVDPTASLTAGLGETAAMAAIGGAGLGGISGALRRPGMPEQPPAPPPAAPVPPDIFMPPEPPVDMAPPPAPVPPSAAPVAPTAAPAAPPAAPAAPPVDWDSNYFQGLPEGSSTVFQNRDRSSPASITQMQKIAAQPDYSRVSVSREFSYGAPVVISDVALPEEKFGNVATATASDGTKIPVRYAVVDARDLLASNLADGTKNPVYENFDVNAIRAIAGNGRIAGIQAAYDRGTADNYKNELLADTSHGVNPDEIAKYERPVLIRVMPKSYVTPNIADISNISGTLGMSAIEQAKNDVSRVNIGGFDFTEDGNIRPESLNQFISAMPKEEQAALIGPDKKPTRQAIDRAHNALFYKAYGSDTLINLYAQATDVEARNVLNALARVAPKMAQLEGAGEYDIRNTIVQAAEGAINAKRRGLKISDYAQNADMGMDENTLRVLDMFGENSRSGSKMAEELNRLADLALQQSQAGVDMFGEQPKLPIGEVFNQFRPAVTRAPTPPKAEPKEFQIGKSNADIAKEIKGITTVELAKWTVDNAPNSVAKYIAEKVYARVQELDAAGALGDKVKVLSGNRSYTFRGRATYNLARDIADLQQKITIVGPATGAANDPNSGARYSTILHELIHVATIGQLRIQGPSKIQNDLKVVLQAVRKKIREDKKNGVQHPFLDRLKRGINAVQNEAELVTWACVDNDAQNYFATVKMGNTNAFSRLADIMRRLLGIDKQYQTALDRILTSTDELFAQPIEEIKKDIEQFGVGVKTLGVSPEVEAAESDQELVQDVRSKAKDILQKRPPLGEQSMAGLPQDFVDSLNKVFAPRNETVIDRIEGMKDRFWQRLAQGVADKYRTIKDYSEDAYMKARMSTTVDGALEGLLFHGHVVDDGGALNIRQNTKGLIKIMEPVGKEVDRYHIWVALNRDARMPADKKSIDPDLVARRDELIEGTLNGKPRKEVYEGVLKEMNAINKSVLDIALAKGLIDQKGYDRFSSDIFYIPFYKAMEDGDLERPSTASSLGGQYFSKQLKGGERPFADLMENTLRNWNHILSASMKNAAGKATVDAAMKHGAAIPNLKPAFEMGDDGLVYSRSSGDVVGDGSVQPYMTESGRGTIKIMQDGRPTYYEIRDPLLFESIAAISYMGPKSKFLSVAQDFKNILQFGVTASPIFKTNNLIRDSVSAMGVSDLKKNPIANVLQGMSLYDKDSPNYIAALSGGAIFNFGTAYEGNQSKLIRRLIDQGTKEETILDTTDKIKNALKVTWDKYQDLGNKSEAANRLALYQQLRDRGMSHLQASFMARDLLDFSMQGSWPAFRMLTQTVPFLNARVQGLYKLGRDGIIPTARVLYNTATGKEITESDRRKAQNFGVVTMGVMLASAMLYLAFKDDEDYQNRDEWDRDNFWWFKLPGMDVAFRIPKPFEIGAFGTLVERILEQTLDSGAEGKQFTDSLSRTLWDTFSMNPTPQFLKPLIDIYANKDSFTGSPIETAGLERLSKQERIVDTTSPLAIALGGLTSILPEKAQLSPVQVDYMIKGYFGWLGGMASTASMYAVMPFREGEYPDARWLDRASLGLAKELPSNQSRYITAFYDNDRAISQAYADMRHYAEIGDAAKVMEILEEKGDKIELATFYDKTAKNMANMRKQIRVIMADESMTGAEKKEEIDRIKQMIGLLAQQAEEVRKSLKD